MAHPTPPARYAMYLGAKTQAGQLPGAGIPYKVRLPGMVRRALCNRLPGYWLPSRMRLRRRHK